MFCFVFFFPLHFGLDVVVLRSQVPVTQREDLRIRVLAQISLLYPLKVPSMGFAEFSLLSTLCPTCYNKPP